MGRKPRNPAPKEVLAVSAGRAAVGTAVSAHSCIQMLWHFMLTLTTLLLLLQYPIRSCPSPLGELLSLQRETEAAQSKGLVWSRAG